MEKTAGEKEREAQAADNRRLESKQAEGSRQAQYGKWRRKSVKNQHGREEEQKREN